MTVYTVSLKDAKSQPCSVSLPMTQMTAANHDTVITNAGLFKALVLNVIEANEYSEQVTHSITKNASYTRPTSGYANRENKVAFTLQGDTTGKLYNFEIPAPDMDQWPFNTDGKEIYDAPFSGLDTDVQLLIDGIEDYFSGDNGETVTVIRFRFVGRNL